MRAFLFDCGTRDSTASLGILALRVFTGLMMLLGHGIPKLMGFQDMAKGFFVPDFLPLSYMSSEVSLIACLVGELLASSLIVVGLATRPAAFVLGFTMVVAAFHVHGADPLFMGPGVAAAKEPALLYLIPCVALILSGAGSYSLDALLHHERRRRRW